MTDITGIDHRGVPSGLPVPSNNVRGYPFVKR